jgi:hypothetical protein
MAVEHSRLLESAEKRKKRQGMRKPVRRLQMRA